MTIEKVRDFFGIKYVIPYNLTTKKPIAVLRAIGEISFENAVEAVRLVGGHVEAPHDIEYGQPEPAMTGTVREYPPEFFQIMETSTITETTAQTAGNVSALTNAQGTSIFSASNGISVIAVTTAADLLFGEHVFVATAAQTLDLHLKGLPGSFLDIDGKIVSGISTTTAGSVAIEGTGLTLTVAGTPAYTIGDTAYCNVKAINTGSTRVLVGAGTVPSNFGVRCVFPKKSDGVLHYIDVFNVAGRGLSWKGVSREFSETDINWSPLARASDGAVYEMVRVLGS